MGCDIHSFVEVKKGNNWELLKEKPFPADDFHKKYYKEDFTDDPFPYRNYGLFGFLADVRNYSCVEPISEDKGFPNDASIEVVTEKETWDADGHSHSWLTLEEMLSVDYDKIIWDKRVTRQVSPNCWDGSCEANEGEGEHLSLREFLGQSYFQTLDILKTLGSPESVRVVFWFDN
jgi:hypothetical protein